MLLRDHVCARTKAFRTVHDLVGVLLLHLLHSAEFITVISHTILSVTRSRAPSGVTPAIISPALQVGEFVPNFEVASVELTFEMHSHALVCVTTRL